MAVAFVKNHTVTGNKVAGTTFDLTLDTAVPAGGFLVARVLFDNAGTAFKPVVSSIARPAGETVAWTTSPGGARSGSTSAGAFASGEMMAIRTSVIWPAGSYAVTLDTSVTQKAGFLQEFSGVSRTTVGLPGNAYSTSTTAASAATTGTAPAIGDLTIGFIFGSNVAAAQAGDTDTTGGSWSSPVGVGTTGSTAPTNNFGIAQYKILTSASHQTLNNSAVMTAGNGVIVVNHAQYVPAPTTQAAFRFYDDGTETGSTALAAQDTGYTANAATSDVNLQLRVRLQFTTNPGLVDWQLQYQLNSGTWTNVGTGAVVGYDSASLTDGAATTNRLGAGTGSFFAGKVSEDGLINVGNATVNTYTEHLYSLTLKAASLVNTDVLNFRVLHFDSATPMTYSVTPTVTINPPPSTVNATGAGSWGAWTGTASATVTPQVLGVGAGTWGATTATALATVEQSAVALGAWGAWAATATAAVDHAATGLGAWGALTGTALAAPERLATGAGAWGALTGTALGTTDHPATAVGAWGAWSATALGPADGLTTGTAEGAWGALTGTAAATVTAPTTGTATGNWGALTATGTATVNTTVNAIAAGSWGMVTATALGTTERSATAAGNWGTWTATATGTVRSPVVATGTGQWGAWTATAITATSYPVLAVGIWGGWTATATGEGTIAVTAVGLWGSWTATVLARAVGVKGTVGGATALVGIMGGATTLVASTGGAVVVVGSVGTSASAASTVGGELVGVGAVGGAVTVVGSVGAGTSVTGVMDGATTLVGAVGAGTALVGGVGGTLEPVGAVGGGASAPGSVGAEVS